MSVNEVKAVVHLERQGLAPEDTVLNTTYWSRGAGWTPAAMVALVDWIADSYQSPVGGQGVSLNSYLSGEIVRGLAPVHSVHLYVDPQSPGSPDYVGFFSLADTGFQAEAVPSEIALCLSYSVSQAELVAVPEEAPDSGDPGTAPDRPRARRRGRQYYGPFNVNALGGPTDQRPNPLVISALLGIGQHFLDAFTEPGLEALWTIYSRVDDLARPVAQGWVDDAWDVQRRRGVARTNRAFFP